MSLIHVRFGSGENMIDVHLSVPEAKNLMAFIGAQLAKERPKMEPRVDPALAAIAVDKAITPDVG